jgi:hypothetical protein
MVSPQKNNLGDSIRLSLDAKNSAPRATVGKAAIVTHFAPSLLQHNSAFQRWTRHVPLSTINHMIVLILRCAQQ